MVLWDYGRLVGVKPEAIMAAVGKYYGIKPEELKGRGWRYTEPRYVASYLMRRYGFMGLREAGGSQARSDHGSGREILRHQTRRDEGKRLAVYGAEVRGELLDEAIWFYG